MRLTFRAKLTVILGVAAAAFVVTIVSSSLLSNRVEKLLADVELRQLPRLEIGPRLERRLEQLQRALQDAVAAHDLEALAATHEIEAHLLEEILAARGVVTPGEVAVLRAAVEDYYVAAVDISRRLISGETGEALVEAMAGMQGKQAKALDLTKTITAPDRRQLTESFQAAARAQSAGGRTRVVIGGLCMLLVIGLSTWMSRGVLRSLAALGTGLERFGDGNLASPIVVSSHDELADVAQQANQMARSLQQLSAERERADWIRRGQNGLAEQLRGELSPSQVATQGIAFLARTLGAPVGALYALDGDGSLNLLGHYAGSPILAAGSRPNAGSDPHPGAVVPSFRAGEGLVGEAAAQREILVISDPPADYLRVRSGLGEGAIRTLILAPLTRNERVIGVVELGLFKPWAEPMRDLLMAVHESFAIAIEVARARQATRELLAETQRQAERLTNQEEVLRATNEELQAQQEELRQTNLDLGRQADELESQRRTLEEQNAELQDAREGLEQKAAELTTVSNYKSQFLANMSHELRTPLNSMLLLSNLLAENESKNLTPKQVEFARTVYQAGRDLLTLINQVLDLAKVESGKQELRLEAVDLGELGARMERVFGPLVRDKGLSFAVKVASDLPARIHTDRQRVEQILNNLIGNAIKFTPSGQVTLRIERPAATARFRREGLRAEQAVAFGVSDTGLGIAPADQERIFAPFEQIEATPDRRYGGTGLGLSIARELASWLGGELQLESTLGKGSTFTCTLPEALRARASAGHGATEDATEGAAEGTTNGVTDDATMTSATPADSGAPPEAAAHRGSPRSAAPRGSGEPHLLLIEDDPNFAMAFGEIIKGQGLKYQLASTGRAGLDAARTTHPTGIILDVKLPDVDGWSVLRQLREDPTTAAIPIHFVSALDGAEHGMALGATGYLTKPATRRQLIRVIQSLAPGSTDRRPRVLVVEDDVAMSDSLVKQLAGENLEVRRAASAAEALTAVKAERFGCMILDLSLPDMDGLELLQLLREQCGADMPSVVVYTGRALTKAETQSLEAYTEAIVLKEGASNERLLDEIRLFVRRLKDGLGSRRPAAALPNPAHVRLEGRKILVVDDDMRTVYALSAMLRSKGAAVLAADTGKAALTVLDESPTVDAILMDIMMPEMDGYEAMRHIRKDPRFQRLPIVALTAKAMKGDDEKCREAGATDYLPKPVDADRLLRLLQERLLEKGTRGA